MGTWLRKNKETITYFFVIIGIFWLILIAISFAVEAYKALWKVDHNDGVVSVLEKVQEVANHLLELVVPLVLVACGLIMWPFLAGAGLFIAGALIVVGLIGVVSTAFSFFGRGGSSEVGGDKNLNSGR